MTELIAKLQAAEAGSRELDAAIAKHVGDPEDVRLWCMESGLDWPAPFTTSTDAALTLVPKGYAWAVCNKPGGRGFGMCLSEFGSYGHEWIEAGTPALALCVAALTARLP